MRKNSRKQRSKHKILFFKKINYEKNKNRIYLSINRESHDIYNILISAKIIPIVVQMHSYFIYYIHVQLSYKLNKSTKD